MPKTLFDLSGKIAVVTGGSRGLGLGLAETLGEYGASVVLISRKEADLAEALAHLAAQGIQASAVPANLADPATVEQVVARIVAEQGRIDILVNNAGTAWGAPAEEQTPDQWAKVIDLNQNAVFFMAQQVAKQSMIPARSGRILNIASIEGLVGHHSRMTAMIGYSTAKGAVIQMTRALAAEWGRYGININALAPGYFLTKLTAGFLGAFEQDVLDATPLGRIGTVDDMKGAALLLCSDAGRHITGHTLVIDGGTTII
jgi:NAD(P)-dependent dehydrogenase (short-subunit alcohol dehydrogenase family)